MEPRAVHHVSINVDNVDVALEFYTKKLGLKVRGDRPDFGFGGAWLNAGGQEVHLIEGPPPPAQGQHFALLFDDLDSAITELRQAKVEVTDPIPVGTNRRQAFLNDPAGNQIELHELS
jgi:catechol 2,3-dioxygenase-like lactoylglutathione lyase family enzyme